MEEDTEQLTCIFTNCTASKEEIKKLSEDRLASIAKASSEQREDGFNNAVVLKLKADGVTLASHRSYVSSNTSKSHIARCKKTPKEPEPKRLRRSNENLFHFQSDCFFCDKECVEKDAKHPDRWKTFFHVRIVYMKNWEPFKDFILKICDIRSDSWSSDVKSRVNSALSDLHAADARYHQDCRLSFLHSKYVDLAAKTSGRTVVDSALDYVKCTIKSKKNDKEWWDSVEIFRLYSENGGHILSRRSLVSKLVDYFGKEIAYLSCPGHRFTAYERCHENRKVWTIANSNFDLWQKWLVENCQIKIWRSSVVEYQLEAHNQISSSLTVVQYSMSSIGQRRPWCDILLIICAATFWTGWGLPIQLSYSIVITISASHLPRD